MGTDIELPSCLDCKYAGEGYPCHKADGSYDFAKVGRGVVMYGRSFSQEGGNLDPELSEQHAWASDCAFEVEQDYPHLLLPLSVAAMDACETPDDAAYIAAGLLENAVVKHGPKLIGTIEELAARSAKFRYFLSGIFGQRDANPAVWARVCKAVGSHGLMDTDARGPASGSDAQVLNDAAARALLKDRVTEAVSGILKF